MNKRDINWTFENLCVVAVYIVIFYGIVYHLFYTLPTNFYNRLRYGKLDDEYIKKYGNDYSMKKRSNCK